MLYMVEMDMPYPDRLEAWEAWYASHIKKLLALPGFRSAQRFRALTPTPSPYLAIYGLASADALVSPEYRAKAGPGSTGEWRTLMTNWRRNLVKGLAEAPPVAPEHRLVMIDRLVEAAPPLPSGFTSLTPVDLDRSMVERGIRVCPPAEAMAIARGDDTTHVRVFSPLGPRQGSMRF